MPNCPMCGNKVDEGMAFCPKCGAALKGAQVQGSTQTGPVTYRRHDEKAEKHEKDEKAEKREKHEHPFIGLLIAGLVVLFIGLLLFLQASHIMNSTQVQASVFVIIGVIIIVGAIYGAIIAGRRYPRTS